MTTRSSMSVKADFLDAVVFIISFSVLSAFARLFWSFDGMRDEGGVYSRGCCDLRFARSSARGKQSITGQPVLHFNCIWGAGL